MEERRNNPHCNLYDIHCKQNFEDIKQDIKDIKKCIIGNGDPKNSLVYQATLNTNHRVWMESWGRMVLGAITVAGVGFIGSLVWVVNNIHASVKP